MSGIIRLILELLIPILVELGVNPSDMRPASSKQPSSNLHKLEHAALDILIQDAVYSVTNNKLSVIPFIVYVHIEVFYSNNFKDEGI